MPRYLDPKNDLIFKRIFGEHAKLLKSFLNAVLPLPKDCHIESLTYLPLENVPEIEGLKHTLVDVRCLDKHGRHFIVEMQLQWSRHFTQRMLFNIAATYVRQVKKGEDYKTLSPVYGLAIVDDVFSKGGEWFHHYQMKNSDGTKKLEDIQLVLIELPKLKPTSISEKKLAILWLRFLKEIGEQTEKVDPSLLEVEEIREALTLLEIASYTEAELLAYDRNWDSISAEKTLMSDKYEDGLMKGRAEGKKEMIINMHRLGLPFDQIANAAQMKTSEVEKLLQAIE